MRRDLDRDNQYQTRYACKHIRSMHVGWSARRHRRRLKLKNRLMTLVGHLRSGIVPRLSSLTRLSGHTTRHVR